MAAVNGYHPNSIAVRFKPGNTLGVGWRKNRNEPYNRARIKALDASPRMINHLIKIADDKSVPLLLRISAIEKLLDRGMGRPLQQLKIDDGSSGAGPELLRAMLDALNQRLRQENGELAEAVIEGEVEAAPAAE